MKHVIKQRFFPPNQIRFGIWKYIHIPTRFVVMAGCLLAILLPVLYLYQTNEVAQKGFEIRELEKTLADLQKDHFEMTQQVTQLQSGPDISLRLQELEMEKIDVVDYLDAQYTDVAYVRNQTY